MRPTTQALLAHYVDALGLSGDVLEIGGHRLSACAIKQFPEPRFRYADLNLAASDIPHTIVADITDCRNEVADASFDLVVSSDVFEHIDRPWLAAAEIGRILRPGGVVVTHTLWSWRNHPCPIDYWRYSAECLEFLFADLEVLESGYDLSQRRVDQPGFWPSGRDSVPVDALGGWREHWTVYCVARRGEGPAVPPFKTSDHPQAHWLRQSTQGVVTNPRLVNPESTAPGLRPAESALAAELTDRLDGLTARTEALAVETARLTAILQSRPPRRWRRRVT